MMKITDMHKCTTYYFTLEGYDDTFTEFRTCTGEDFEVLMGMSWGSVSCLDEEEMKKIFKEYKEKLDV